MFNLRDKFKSRFQESYEKVKDAYLHKETREPPVVIMDVNYYLTGEKPEFIPDDYFTNYKSMMDYQFKKIVSHLERFSDDYIPLLFPWYGTGVVPSALGCKIAFQQKMDPTIEGIVINRPEDIKSLEIPDPYKDGLMPIVLECIDYMKKNSNLPVSFTDCQGPLNIALSLCGMENLCIWMYEYPEYVHELMDFCTEVLIQWVKIQKKHAGQKYESGAFPHGIVLPEGFGGIWIADDDAVVLSPDLYKEFVVPYNSKVFKSFGGGTLHFCGNAEHQLENFLDTEGITGINNFCMGNFKQVYRMQEMFDSKLALMVCDFTPLNIEEYYTELIRNLKFKGTILATFPAPELALYKGKYESISRDGREISEEAEQVIYKLIKSRV